MNQLLLYGVIAVCGLVLMLSIPGLKVIGELGLKMLSAVFALLFSHAGAIFIWCLKTFSADHMRILEHAIKTRDEIDPTQKIRRKAAGFES